MKKIFLLFGIVSCSAVSAQEKDFFNIQDHLQKKQAEARKNEKIKLELPSFNTPNSYSNFYSSNKPDQTYTSTNGDKVIILGQDNMPCIVSDMSLFKAMPNPGYEGNPYNNNLLSMRQRKPGQIPNGALPFRIMDSK